MSTGRAQILLAPDGAVTLIGSGDEIRAVAEIFMRGEASSVDLESSSPVGPYSAAAKRLVVASDGKAGVLIRCIGDEVHVTGDRASRVKLGENLVRLGRDPEALGGHIHVEHYPGHPYLRAFSAPLVVDVT